MKKPWFSPGLFGFDMLATHQGNGKFVGKPLLLEVGTMAASLDRLSSAEPFFER